jgi:NAD(P)-dependent dehydrogenase (short-subunit alcohol dehydrogenase family)
MRLEGKTAIIIGAGQVAGEGLGNGRATALRFAQEGARIMAVDRNLTSAEETARMIRDNGGDCFACEADVTKESTLAAAISEAHNRWGHIDILHYNVGVNVAAGDATLLDITEDIFDRVSAINLRGAIMSCKHVIPIMRQQKNGVIITISSNVAITTYSTVAYKATKAALIAFTQQVAIQNAEYGIRANVILPGTIDTPHSGMAVESRARMSGRSVDELAKERGSWIPLRHKMGTAWDVANAALFLASDEANFITGVALPVDGGSIINIAPR